MGNESTSSLEQAERVDHQLVRGIGISALTANIVSSTMVLDFRDPSDGCEGAGVRGASRICLLCDCHGLVRHMFALPAAAFR